MKILSIWDGDSFICLSDNTGGQVVLLFFNPPNKDNIVCINRLYVHYHYRRLGWATFVMSRLMAKFPNSVFLVTALSDNIETISNEDLINFYGQFGFKIEHQTDDGTLLKKS